MTACSKKAPSEEAIKEAKERVEQMSSYLPSQVNDNMMLDEVTFDSDNYTIVYRYSYILPIEKPSPEQIDAAKEAILALVKAVPDDPEIKLLEEGIICYYNYYNPNGDFVFAIKITADDLKK